MISHFDSGGKGWWKNLGPDSHYLGYICISTMLVHNSWDMLLLPCFLKEPENVFVLSRFFNKIGREGLVTVNGLSCREGWLFLCAHQVNDCMFRYFSCWLCTVWLLTCCGCRYIRCTAFKGSRTVQGGGCFEGIVTALLLDTFHCITDLGETPLHVSLHRGPGRDSLALRISLLTSFFGADSSAHRDKQHSL